MLEDKSVAPPATPEIPLPTTVVVDERTAGIFKPALVNSFLILASIAFTYLVLEFTVFRPFLNYVPLKLYARLPHEMRMLGQDTKESVLPKDYIALAGDSYAQGYGDWLLSGDVNGRPPYHTAHILHSKLNQDVVTFGASGAGSLRGIVTEPIAQWSYLNSTGFYSLQAPKDILVYFYSGNDLNNNLADLKERFFTRYPASRVRDRDLFRRFIDEVVLGENDTYVRARKLTWKKHLWLARTMFNFLKAGVIVEATDADPGTVAATPPRPVGWAKIAGARVPLPDNLQAPSLDLTPEELELGSYVFDQAVLYLKGFFSRTRLSVIYVPSPLESYELASAQVDAYSYEKRGTRYSAKFLARRSDEVRELIESATKHHGLFYLDATPFIRAASRQSVVHGPKDWQHFNRKGYEALAMAALTALSRP